MGTTPDYNLPFPELTDTPNVPRDMRLLAEATEQALGVALPIGAVIAYGSSTVPKGWALCDGKPHNSAALRAITGSPNTPNLSDRFIMGIGTTAGVGAAGGAATVKLTAAESGMPAHNHSATSGAKTAAHTHGGTTGHNNSSHAHGGTTGHNNSSHTHTGSSGSQNTNHEHGYTASQAVNNAAIGGVAGLQDQSPNLHRGNIAIGRATFGSGSQNRNHQHTISIGTQSVNHGHPFTTLTQSTNHGHPFTTASGGASHNHTVSVSNATAKNATSAHENRPPFIALAYIIKIA